MKGSNLLKINKKENNKRDDHLHLGFSRALLGAMSNHVHCMSNLCIASPLRQSKVTQQYLKEWGFITHI